MQVEAARVPVFLIFLSGFAAGISGDSGRVDRSFQCDSVPSVCTETQTERQKQQHRVASLPLRPSHPLRMLCAQLGCRVERALEMSYEQENCDNVHIPGCSRRGGASSAFTWSRHGIRGISQNKDRKHMKLDKDRVCVSIWVRNRKCQPGHCAPGLELRI